MVTPSAQAVEAGAKAAFWQDDLGGHIKGRWTWDTIPEDGRENYRAVARAVLDAAFPGDEDPLEQELLREKCESLGLPVSLKVLLRHIENNHAATLSFKDLTIKALEEKLAEARQRAISDVDAVVDELKREAKSSRVLRNRHGERGDELWTQYDSAARAFDQAAHLIEQRFASGVDEGKPDPIPVFLAALKQIRDEPTAERRDFLLNDLIQLCEEQPSPGEESS